MKKIIKYKARESNLDLEIRLTKLLSSLEIIISHTLHGYR